MKQSEFTKCILCDQGVMHAGDLTFYSLRLAHQVINVGAVQRQFGLETMMGPAAVLAQVLGPNEDLAREAYSREVLICQGCAYNSKASFGEILVRIASRNEVSSADEGENQ